MRAALYARVSSQEQVEGYSIDAQRHAFKTLVESKGWTAYREYIDEGKSARSDDINKRPYFKEMIDDAISKKFDVLVVHKLDRFARNLYITLHYLKKLEKAGVDFVSISEQFDLTTPSGKVHFHMIGLIAEFYSDNLSQETKKGWAERRAQGLYCGHLPFGAMKVKNQDVPVRNPDTYPGLEMAFKLASQGKCDREIAVALNAAGYRTAGVHGTRLFSKDTVNCLLHNPFYIGYLSDGKKNGGKDKYVKAKHQPFIDQGLFEAVRRVRQKNMRSTHKHTVNGKTIYSLTGITWCWYCKENGHPGRMHVACKQDGKVRLGCYNRTKGWDCQQKSTFLSTYEEQIRAYIYIFQIPDDYQQKILDMHKKLEGSYSKEKDEKPLKNRLEKLKELYLWGDISKEEYQKEKEIIQAKLIKLSPVHTSTDTLKRLGEFISNIGQGWDVATHEQRSKLARCLFEEVWVKDKEVVAVKPQPELEPFFQLNWEEFVKIMKLKVQGPSAPPCSQINTHCRQIPNLLSHDLLMPIGIPIPDLRSFVRLSPCPQLRGPICCISQDTTFESFVAYDGVGVVCGFNGARVLLNASLSAVADWRSTYMSKSLPKPLPLFLSEGCRIPVTCGYSIRPSSRWATRCASLSTVADWRNTCMTESLPKPLPLFLSEGCWIPVTCDYTTRSFSTWALR